MKILILTDSRGQLPGKDRNWVDLFISQNKSYDIIKKNWTGGRVATIFQQIATLKEENIKYNLIITQSGYHDYVVPWPKNIIRIKLKGADPNFEDYLIEETGGGFIYRNNELVKKTFNEFLNFTDKILFVSMHSCIENWDLKLLYMNKIFSFNKDCLFLPMHKGWKEENAIQESRINKEHRIHYNENGAKFICGFIDRFVKRYNKSICDII